MFLPLGDYFSVDAALKPKQATKRRPQYLYASVSSFAYMMQVLVMYMVAHELKNGKEWRIEGTSAWLVSHFVIYLILHF